MLNTLKKELKAQQVRNIGAVVCGGSLFLYRGWNGV